MGQRNEFAQKAVSIEVALEALDRRAATPVLAFPIGLRGRVEGVGEILLIGALVRNILSIGEHTIEMIVVRQVLDRCQFQFVERNVCRVQVNRRYVFRACGQIAEYVATARGDGDHAGGTIDLEGLHVDDRVFPDLRVNKMLECVGETAFEQSIHRERAVLMYSVLQQLRGVATKRARCGGHEVLPKTRM